MTKQIGEASGLDYDLNVEVSVGLLTCEECGRLPGWYSSQGEGEEAARRHLGATHKMLLLDAEDAAHGLANREAWFEAEADDYGLG